jgi:prepilin-type N-terminal cleavage/methylation domain-containing protein
MTFVVILERGAGFTLIELLAVIAILALLMSVIIISINPAEILKKTRDVRRITDLNTLHRALQ